jgi:outer membrane lipopolysaccharide assembly protein LptE/RlpB
MKQRGSYRNFISALVLLSSVYLAGACGYHFSSVYSSSGAGLESLAIPTFSSTSSFAGFEGEFTRLVREEFIKHSRVRIEGKETAQAVLSGRLYSIKTEPLSYTVTQRTVHGFPSSYEVTRSRLLKVKVEVTLTDTRTGEIIWENDSLTDEASFRVTSNPMRTEYNQREALIAIGQDLARRIYSMTMGRF